MRERIYKNNKYKNTLVLLGTVIVVLGVLFFAKVFPYEQREDAAGEYNHNWYYMQKNEKIHISLPVDIQLKEEASITIYNDNIVPDNAGKYIFIKNAIYRPEIYLNDDLLYQYTDGGLQRNPPELSYQVCKGKIKDSIETGTMKIIYHKSNDNIISLPAVYTGSEDTIIRDIFFGNAYITFITITLIMLGALVLLAALITKNQNYSYKRKLLMLGLFLLTIGIWCLSDSPLVQYLLGYSNVNMYADFFIFMFLLAPFVGYVRSSNGMEKYKSLKYIVLASFINAAIQTVLALLDIFTYIKMVPVTHFLIVAGLITSIFLLCKEYFVNKNREVYSSLKAFAVAGIFSVFSIVIYFLKPELFYQNLLQTGLLLFILILLWNIVTEYIENLRYKAEANIYRQMAEADKLTNLKNRRGFDLNICEIEKNTDKFDNVLLIFIDINGLKRINDSYGHTKGDETIVAAAGCIERAYDSHGTCYRIGGDEFCTIIENPLFSEHDAVSFVEHEVDKYNKNLTDDCYLSVAIGCSFLKERDGTIKNIKKWKEEADYRMYEDKKEKKFHPGT